MGFFPVKRPPFVLAACLALSVIGTFTAADIAAFDFREKKPAVGGSLTSADADCDTIYCLAGCTVKAGRCAFLPSRKSMRIIAITPFGTLCAGIVALFSVMKLRQTVNMPDGKDTILLKLRI
jgi:hypothetical protein